MVITAYTLFELPSMKTRLQTILNLWNKTKQYLVIVEYGSNSGFKLVNEARDYILSIKDPENIGHVFAPVIGNNLCLGVRSETIVTYNCNHAFTLHYDCNSFVRIFFTIVTISERL